MLHPIPWFASALLEVETGTDHVQSQFWTCRVGFLRVAQSGCMLGLPQVDLLTNRTAYTKILLVSWRFLPNPRCHNA